ncbi:MAG: thioredoxin family protein [Ignavibacteria bacterium]
MKTFLIIFTALILTPLINSQTNSPGSGKYIPVEKFDPSRDPAEDLNNAVAEAKRTDKRILLDVGGEWCIWCHYLDKFFEENEDIADYMYKYFVVLKINYSKENENKKFLSKYPKIPGYPHLFVLDENGKLLHSQNTSELEKGRGHDREKVFAFLKEWARSS